MNNTSIMNRAFYDPEDSMVQLTQDDLCTVSGYNQQNRSKKENSLRKSLQYRSSIKSNSVLPSTCHCPCSQSHDGYESSQYLENTRTNSKMRDNVMWHEEEEEEDPQCNCSDSMEINYRTALNSFQKLQQTFGANKDPSKRSLVTNAPPSYVEAKKRFEEKLQQFVSLAYVPPLPNSKGGNAMKENILSSVAIVEKAPSPRVDKMHTKPVATLRKMFMGPSKVTEQRKPLQQVQPVTRVNYIYPLTKRTTSSTIRVKRTSLQPAPKSYAVVLPQVQITPPTPSPARRSFMV